MGRLLDHSFPDAPTDYEYSIFQRILRDVEISLTKKEIPSEIEGKDENNALTWFLT